MKLNEKLIVKKIIQKEYDAYETFYHKYVELVCFVINLYIKNKEIRDEVIQEVFIHLFDQMILFDPSVSTLKIWIAINTKNYCLKYLKKNPSYQTINSENSLFLKEDVKITLAPLEYQVLFLKFKSKMKDKEVAEFLNIALNTTKKTYQELIQRINSLDK